ncbi:MAG: hypothetical protein HYZ54_05005 [Ignavibacteriae bacterium]|nr:hypothetical protein [Ignavibacteriota bacterium]
MFDRKVSVIHLVCFILLCLTPLTAQQRLDVSGMGLARATVAFARGTDALTINPANIITNDTSASLLFTVMPIGVMVGSNVFSVKDINYYFGGDGTIDSDGHWNPRYLSPSERDKFVQMVDDGTIATQTETMPIGIVVNIPNFGAVGFSIINSLQMQLRFPENFSKVFDGYGGKEPLDLSGGLYNVLHFSSYGFTYAQNIRAANVYQDFLNSVNIGLTVKYIRGYSMQGIDASNTAKITPFIPAGWDSTYDWAVDLRYKAQQAGNLQQQLSVGNFTGFGGTTAGTGIGLDMGFWGALTKPDSMGRQASFAFSLLDIGSITWDESTETYNADVRDTIKGVAQLTDERIDLLKGVGRTASFSTLLPMRFRVGVSMPLGTTIWDIPVTAMADYTQGLVTAGINTTIPRFGLGFQLGEKGILGRIGFQAGGIEGFGVSAGIGSNWETVNFDISAGSVRALLGYASAHLFDYSLGIKFRLPVNKLPFF